MREPSLQELQQWMKARIRPQTAASAVGADLLNPQRGTPGEERLAVYAGGYRARIRQALAEVYEAVHQVLGEHGLTELAEDYARAVPSHEYDLSAAGRRLPAFLAGWPKTAVLPFLPDLARLEWLVREAFHAWEEPPLEFSRVSGIPLKAWDRTRVVFQPSVGVAASAWPILDIWQARLMPRRDVNVDLVNRPQQVLVYRRGFQVACEAIDVHQHALLVALLAGRTLGAACGVLAGVAKSVEPKAVTAWFRRWGGLGLIVRWEVV